jgi:serine/threonine protein kinase
MGNIKVGDDVLIGYNCPASIQEVVMRRGATGVFVVDIHTDLGTIHKVLKIELEMNEQLVNELEVREHLDESSFFMPTTVVINNRSYNAIITHYLGLPLDNRYITDKTDKKELFRAALKQLKLIHSKNVLHEDIKPENIVFDAVFDKVSLIDYGFAQIVEKDIPYRPKGFTVLFSSPYVALPDMLQLPDLNNSYRALDDYIALVYTFLSYYVPYFDIEYLIKNLKKSAKKFESKTGPKSTDTFDEAYGKAIEALPDADFSERSVLAIQFLKTMLQYDTMIRPYVPDWLDSYIRRVGIKKIFGIPLEKIKSSYLDTVNKSMKPKELAEVLPELFSPMYGYKSTE